MPILTQEILDNHMSLELLRKNAVSMIYNHTHRSIDLVYGPIADDETRKLIQYKLQTRVYHYAIEFGDNIEWNDITNVSEASLEKVKAIIAVLAPIDYTVIRKWWHDIGQDKVLAAKEKREHDARLANCVYAVRIDNAFIGCNEDGEWCSVKTASEAIGWTRSSYTEEHIESMMKLVYGNDTSCKVFQLSVDKVGLVIQ